MAAWLCALAGSLLYADSYMRQPGADVQHYVFRIALSDRTDEIFGETTVRCASSKTGWANSGSTWHRRRTAKA